MVSGALAVLKSRLTAMPMEVVQAVLLWSADPVGEREQDIRKPDPVYGWGRLNLARAITMQGAVSLPFSTGSKTDSVALARTRATLSAPFAHALPRLRTIETAARGPGGAYWNARLSDVFAADVTSSPPPGFAARDMIVPAGDWRVGPVGLIGPSAEIDRDTGALDAAGLNIPAGALGSLSLRYDLRGDREASVWTRREAPDAAPFFDRSGGAFTFQMQGSGPRPFVAFGDSGDDVRRAPWSQYGLQWRGTAAGLEFAAEVSRIDERRSVWGSDFGALGRARTETRRVRLDLNAPLDGTWRGFAGWERNAADVSTADGMMSGIAGLRAEGWSAGLRGQDVFREGGILQFAVRQDTRVTSGQARFDRFVATGAGFVDAFWRGEAQSLERRQAAVELKAPPARRYSLGYAMPLADNAAFAFGLEYEDGSDAGAVSTHLRMEF